jgi:ketosteroid isomerase-like protein
MRQTTSMLLLCMMLGSAALPAAAHTPEPFASTSATTARVAERYFEAYIARDWDRLAPLLAESGGFADPTAEPVFGKVEVTGKRATVEYFRANYAAIRHMQFNRTRAFFSGRHAVFEGTLDWTLALGGGKEAVTLAMPFVTILRIEDGLVVEHRDFADHQPFVAAHRRATGG